MRRPVLVLAIILATAIPATTSQAHHPAQGNFGINGFDLVLTNRDGTVDEQAGSHPFALTTSLATNVDGEGEPEGWLRDFMLEVIPGMVADTTAYPRCSNADFLAVIGGVSSCPLNTILGVNAVSAEQAGQWRTAPVYNLTPPPGVLTRIGFTVLTANVIVDIGLAPTPPYNGIATSRNTSQVIEVLADKLQLWGNPSDPAHDKLRGACGVGEFTVSAEEEFEFQGSGEACPPVKPSKKPFLTLPTDCSRVLSSRFEAISWEGEFDEGERAVHDVAGNPVPFKGCGKLQFTPSIAAAPTNRAGHSPTGLDFSLDLNDEGLTAVDPKYESLSQSHVRKVVVTLPEGMTANPSLAEGLAVCSEEDLEREKLGAAPGEGCPQASKIGTLEVESPLVEEPLRGALFVAKPYENKFGSLLALYMVVKNPKLGVIVKLASKIEPDPRTGQLVTITEDVPPTAVFSHFRLHLREGGRSPLVTPSRCGSYPVEAEIFPWSGRAPVVSSSAFELEGSCAAGGTPPFEPGFEAGSANNSAAAFSPFALRLTRRDGDQDLTRFDATLPRGVLAKLTKVARCSDSQIALAKTKSGTAERQSPSCPAASQIGTVEAGAGVGSELTYVPGSVYLGGPFAGDPLSVVGIVPAVAGPFDVGTVVVRQALKVNPRSGEGEVDGAHSDPIPHILAGIPLVVRDIQIRVDRPDFTLNPTSCDRFATRAAIWGGGADPFSLADNSPVSREARYQAADCSRLGFKPKLSLKLVGGTLRGAFPELHFTYAPRKGDANVSNVKLQLPHSEFIEQGHFRTICTRVQYAAKACPAASIYGHVRAETPLLDEPLEGPVYLRSSSHKLPDAVLALHGLVDIEVVARIDSVHGRLRATVEDAPDAPIKRVVVKMQGAQRGLFVNSTDLCVAKHRAQVQLEAQNSKRHAARPVLAVRCPKKHSGQRG